MWFYDCSPDGRGLIKITKNNWIKLNIHVHLKIFIYE